MDDRFLEPADDEPVTVVSADEQAPYLADYVRSKFEDSENGRYAYEQRWIKAYKNFRGIYDSTTQYRDSERSKVFIKITKTKVLAAYGQIVDILFANKRFPIVVESTPVPEGVAEFAHLKTPVDDMVSSQEALDPYGFEGDGRELAPGAMQAEAPSDYLGAYEDRFANAPVVEGPSNVGEPQISPAQESALKCEKVIHDQLVDTNAVTVIRKSIFESALMGTGVIKGPLNMYKRIHRWQKDDTGERTYDPFEKVVPRIEHVSIWDFYPDPSARQRKTSAGGMTDLAILKNAGFEVKCKNSAPLVRDRINSVNAKLKNAKGQHSLFILNSCKNVIKSIERQIYKEGTHVPDKDSGYDHFNDALGYMLEYNFPLRRDFKPNPPTRWS